MWVIKAVLFVQEFKEEYFADGECKEERDEMHSLLTMYDQRHRSGY
jgi:hypothetical protein